MTVKFKDHATGEDMEIVKERLYDETPDGIRFLAYAEGDQAPAAEIARLTPKKGAKAAAKPAPKDEGAAE